MATKINTQKFLIGALFATAIASPLLLKTQSALAGCRVPAEVSEVTELTNRVRTKYNLRPLRPSCQLYQAAQNHTLNMVEMRRMSHTGSDGSEVEHRVQRVGYRHSGVAENVAVGQNSSSQVVRDWMNSPGHRRNILNPRYTEIGVGYSNNYWTQVFGHRR